MNRILILDDERWVRTSLRRVIELTGLPVQVVHECTDGLSALDWLKREAADLIFADIKMPIMDGLAFIEQLRHNGGRQDVVIISGYDDFSYAKTAMRFGAMDYLLKPVEPDEMRECLDKWLRQNAETAAQASLPKLDEQEQSTFERVARCVREGLPGPLVLKDIAAQVHLNPSYLSQLFKRHTGKAFSDYMAEARLDEAKRLLSRTSLRISDISDRLGYADLGYFSSVFKKYTGLPPSEYRKRCSQQTQEACCKEK